MGLTLTLTLTLTCIWASRSQCIALTLSLHEDACKGAVGLMNSLSKQASSAPQREQGGEEAPTPTPDPNPTPNRNPNSNRNPNANPDPNPDSNRSKAARRHLSRSCLDDGVMVRRWGQGFPSTRGMRSVPWCGCAMLWVCHGVSMPWCAGYALPPRRPRSRAA